MNIAIIDYGMGNLGSIKNMLSYLGKESEITRNKDFILSADKIILPGVGSFDAAMTNLINLDLKSVLEEAVRHKKIHTLGICLGMQLLTRSSEEGNMDGLGFIPSTTRKFNFDQPDIKVPHMGWNYVDVKNTSNIARDLPDDSRFYFVHSYYVEVDSQENSLFKTNYSINFDSGIYKENIYGVQFHPEKSHKFGMKILSNFINI